MSSNSSSTRLVYEKEGTATLSTPKLLARLFAVSFLVHVFIVLIFIHQPIALDDMFQYDMLARSLKEGNGFRWYSRADMETLSPYYSQFLEIDLLSFPEQGLETSFRAPGYPFFLAFLYTWVPASFRFILARLVQAILAAALAPLAAFWGLQAGFSRKVSALSAIGISLYPILLFYPIGLASENLYIVLGMLSVVSIYLSTKKKSLGWVLLAGVLSGATMLTRSIFAFAVLFSGIWLACFNPHRKKAGFLFLLTAFGICVPWSIRNSLLMDKPAFVENSAGYNLFIGYHPEGDGGFVSRIAILPMDILDDGERDRICLRQAIDFIKQNPLESARRIFVRLAKFIGPEDREFFFFYSNNLLGEIKQPWLALIYLLLVIPWGFTLVFGAIGLGQMRDQKLVLLVILFLLGYALPHFFIIAEPRFHLAWVPILAPFTAHGWVNWKKIQWDQVRERKSRVVWVSLTVIGLIFVSGFMMNISSLVAIMNAGGNRLFFSY